MLPLPSFFPSPLIFIFSYTKPLLLHSSYLNILSSLYPPLLSSNSLLMAKPEENGFLMQPGEVECEEQGCGCIQSLGVFTSQKHVTRDGDRLHLLPERRDERESWMMRQVMKLREVSELIAGPKWKNFLRKIGGYFNNNKKRNDFQYNSFDYPLNFDDGNYEDDKDGYNLGFSSRFAPPVVSHDKPTSSTT